LLFLLLLGYHLQGFLVSHFSSFLLKGALSFLGFYSRPSQDTAFHGLSKFLLGIQMRGNVYLPDHAIPHHEVIKRMLTSIAINENCMDEFAGHVPIGYIDDSCHGGLILQIYEHGMALQHNGPAIQGVGHHILLPRTELLHCGYKFKTNFFAQASRAANLLQIFYLFSK